MTYPRTDYWIMSQGVIELGHITARWTLFPEAWGHKHRGLTLWMDLL